MFEQFMTTIRNVTHKKNGWLKFGLNGQKLGSKLIFSPFPQVWIISFSLNYTEYKYVYYIIWECVGTSREKTHIKMFESSNLGQWGQNQVQINVFCNFLKSGSLVLV